MTLGKLALAWVLPLLFLGNVTNQIYHVHTHGLSPWRGGGFGMFASVDTHTHRRLRVIGQDATGNTYRIVFSDVAYKSQWVDRDRIRGLSIYPHQKRLKKFAENLLQRNFLSSGETEEYYLRKIRTGSRSERNDFTITDMATESLPFLRPVKPSETAKNSLELVSIEISAWGRDFDGPTQSIFWRQVGAMVHAKK